MAGTKANRPYKKVEITPVFWDGLGIQAAFFLSIHFKMAGQSAAADDHALQEKDQDELERLKNSFTHISSSDYFPHMENLPILILQLCDAEPGTLIDHELEKQKLPFERIRVFESSRIPNHDTIRAAIILGSPTSVNDFQQYDWSKTLYAWTSGAMRRNIPLLGVCYGSQLLAKILGATVSRHPEMELGVSDVDLTEHGATDPLFAGIEPSFPVAQWHGETWKLPYGATLLCEGDACRNQAFRKGNVVGVQFHLEASLDEMAAWPAIYAQDVKVSGKEADSLRIDFQKRSDELSILFSRLIGNWVKGV